MAENKCSAPHCGEVAAVEVRLYDVYADRVFDEQDRTCPFLCAKHLMDNEARAEGERKPRGVVNYPYSNQERAQGFTIYRWLGR